MERLTSSLPLSALAALVTLNACSETPPAQTAETLGRSAAALADSRNTTLHPEVATVFDRHTDQDLQGFEKCAGVLIGPRRVLTAASCLAAYPYALQTRQFNPFPISNHVYVYFGRNLGFNPAAEAMDADQDRTLTAHGELIRVDSVAMHPDYSRNLFAFGQDTANLAVLKLSATPTSVSPVALAESDSEPLAADNFDARLQVAGYGWHERSDISHNVRMEGEMQRLDPLDPAHGISDAWDDPLLISARGEGELADPCYGDMGLGAFFTGANGKRLVGIGVSSVSVGYSGTRQHDCDGDTWFFRRVNVSDSFLSTALADDCEGLAHGDTATLAVYEAPAGWGNRSCDDLYWYEEVTCRDGRLFDDYGDEYFSSCEEGNYCDDTLKCGEGEGHCRNDDACEEFLVCVEDRGPAFGLKRNWNVCLPEHCADGVMSGDEDEVDCGGSCGPCEAPEGAECSTTYPCVSGAGHCRSDEECASGLSCTENQGAAFGLKPNWAVCLPAHCSDGVQSGDETGVDCGGASCKACERPSDIALGDSEYCSPAFPCASGEGHCRNDSFCEEGLSCLAGQGAAFGLRPHWAVCLPSHCGDDIQNGDETGVDCGGSSCKPCAPPAGAPTCSEAYPCLVGGGDCRNDSFCAQGLSCLENQGAAFGLKPNWAVCLPAHCDDGELNGDETALDCGGSCKSCERPAELVPGHPYYCSPAYPCAEGEGHCRSGDYCGAGLACLEDRGSDFGLSRSWDVCLPEHCADGRISGDEMNVDCGGSCGPCEFGARASLVFIDRAANGEEVNWLGGAHVGLHLPGERILESSRSYSLGDYSDVLAAQTISVAPDTGVQNSHTLGSFVGLAATSASTNSWNGALGSVGPANVTLAQWSAMRDFIVGESSRSYAPYIGLLSFASVKGLSGGRYSQAGLLERAAELAQVNAGAGFVPNTLEFIATPHPSNGSTLYLQVLSPSLLHNVIAEGPPSGDVLHVWAQGADIELVRDDGQTVRVIGSDVDRGIASTRIWTTAAYTPVGGVATQSETEPETTDCLIANGSHVEGVATHIFVRDTAGHSFTVRARRQQSGALVAAGNANGGIASGSGLDDLGDCVNFGAAHAIPLN